MRGAIPLLAIPSYFRQISKRERVPALYGFQVRGLLKPKKPNNPPTMNLSKDQKKLICDLIDGYAYPRFLCQCDPSVDTEGVWDRTKEFLEIRQVLDPDPTFNIEDEDTYPDWFQFGYFEHSNFHKLHTDEGGNSND